MQRKVDMMRTLPVLLTLASLPGCLLGGDDPELPPDPAPAPAHCVQPEDRFQRIVRVSGQVVDFTTGQPVAGAAVDLTTAWDTEGDIPAADCPVLGAEVTDAQGRFGPVALYAGAGTSQPIMLFRVSGGGRALTLSDNRACGAVDEDGTCNLAHTIAAPSAALAAAWRAELVSGGMTGADRRGLIAFLYKNSDGSPAAGVHPNQDTFVGAMLRPGVDVRFVDATRGALTPASDAVTGAAGQAVIGLDLGAGVEQGTRDIGGTRDAERWAPVGSLIVPGAIFVEDRTVAPPQ